MKIYRYGDTVSFKSTVVLLGSFESFHQGHLKLLEKAKKLNLPIGILLFDDQGKYPKIKIRSQFQTLKVRLENLSHLKFDFVVVANFMKQLKHLEGDVFIKNFIKTAHINHFICGEDFRFGKSAKYNAQKLKKIFPETIITPIFKINNSKMSTSLLKDDLSLGLVDEVNLMLTSNWRIKAQYMGFANLSISRLQFLPHSGIYYGILGYQKTDYPVLIKVGFKDEIATLMMHENVDFIIGSILDLTFLKLKRLIIAQRDSVLASAESFQLASFFSQYKYKKNN